MLRSILSILAGAAVWAVLWLADNAILAALMPSAFRQDGTTDDVTVLAILIVSSLGFSIVAGYVTAMVAQHREIPHALALGIVQLILGLLFTVPYWNSLPLWYNLVFLTLLIPGNLLGGMLRRDRKRMAATG